MNTLITAKCTHGVVCLIGGTQGSTQATLYRFEATAGYCSPGQGRMAPEDGLSGAPPQTAARQEVELLLDLVS